MKKILAIVALAVSLLLLVLIVQPPIRRGISRWLISPTPTAAATPAAKYTPIGDPLWLDVNLTVTSMVMTEQVIGTFTPAPTATP